MIANLCEEVNTLHEQFQDALITLTERVVKMPLPDLVDNAFLCKILAEKLDDWRKECNARVDLITKVLALRAPTQLEDTVVRGKLASCSLDATIEVALPKRGTPEYDEILKYFQIPIGAPFTPHWKLVQEMIAERYKSGQPLPPGFGEQYTKTRAIFRRHTDGEGS